MSQEQVSYGAVWETLIIVWVVGTAKTCGCTASSGLLHDQGYGLTAQQSAAEKDNDPFSLCGCDLPVLLCHHHWGASHTVVRVLTWSPNRNGKAEPGLQEKVGLQVCLRSAHHPCRGEELVGLCQPSHTRRWTRASQPPHCASLFSRPVIFSVYC